MNAIFALVFCIAGVIFLITDPNGFLPALLAGGEKAGVLCLSLVSVYCVWLGFFSVLEKSGLAQKLARLFAPLAKRLLRTEDEKTIYLAAGNLSANLLGLPGAPTPLGVKATERMLANNNRYGANMLFVLNATSLQLLPTTVIALRLSAGSASPADILLPTILATLFSTLCGILLTRLFLGRKR